MIATRYAALLGLLFIGAEVHAADVVKGYQTKIKVEKPTRLDWSFAVSNTSLDKPPADWLGDYDSTKQAYDLFVPPNYDPKKSYPVMLFISPGNGPGGWKEWEAVCKKEGVIFASPHNAGNDVQPKRRIRLVLDVLDEIRRAYNTDPDRTYLSGHSGGARIAGSIVMALPEFFGGVAPSCAGVELREETWLRQRAVDRLSVAFLTGAFDFNRGECEKFRGPQLAAYGVRAKVFVGPRTEHNVPVELLPEAFQWLEEGLPKRRELAKKYPASRIAGDAAPDREAWAAALLKEATQRLKEKETVSSGIMQLQGIVPRWNGLPAAAAAKKLYQEYDAKADKPWEEEDIAEQRRFLIATARSLTDYATGPLPKQYLKQRPEMARSAISFWDLILKDGQDEAAVAEGKKRLPELRKLADKKD